MRAQEAARKRRRTWFTWIGAGVIAVIAVVAITLAVTSGGGNPPSTASGTPKLKLASLSTLGTLKPLPAAGANGAEGVPVPSAPALAGTATVATGKTVDGISCNSSEQVVYHIHAHLTVFVNGAARQVPAAIGIPGAQADEHAEGAVHRQRHLLLLAAHARAPTGSSTSSHQCTGRTHWATSSTSGASRSGRTRPVRPAAR